MVIHNGRKMLVHFFYGKENRVACNLPLENVWSLTTMKDGITCKRCLKAMEKEKTQ